MDALDEEVGILGLEPFVSLPVATGDNDLVLARELAEQKAHESREARIIRIGEGFVEDERQATIAREVAADSEARDQAELLARAERELRAKLIRLQDVVPFPQGDAQPQLPIETESRVIGLEGAEQFAGDVREGFGPLIVNFPRDPLEDLERVLDGPFEVLDALQMLLQVPLLFEELRAPLLMAIEYGGDLHLESLQFFMPGALVRTPVFGFARILLGGAFGHMGSEPGILSFPPAEALAHARALLEEDGKLGKCHQVSFHLFELLLHAL